MRKDRVGAPWGMVLLVAVFLGGLAERPWTSARALAASAESDLEEFVDKVQAACSNVQDLSARFHQTVSNRALGAVQEASDIFLVKRPGKMRWEYQKPEARLFVADGKTLWVYSPADRQVLAQGVGEAFASRLPLAFLAGDCQLRRDFRISFIEHAGTRASPGTKILDLRPVHPEAGISRVLLEVNLQSHIVEKTTLFDAAANTTVIALSSVKLNTGLGDQPFQFTPPPDATVVSPAKR